MSAGNLSRYPAQLIAALFVLIFSLSGLVACGGESNPVAPSASIADALDDGDTSGADHNTAQDSALAEAKTPGSDIGVATPADSVVISTSLGNIEVALDRSKAPGTVANFLEYVEAGHYDQTIFHRVIPGFMIQGGGFSTAYQRNVTEAPILNEANNGLNNDRYTIAMARTPSAHSATDQFFINVVDNPFLDYSGPTDRTWGYAVFGSVTDGFDVIEDIAAVTTGAAGPFATDAPVELVTIFSIRRQ
jgi:cyclophilin family peptidyl-prolyl cis-trans isomerase